MILGEDTSHKLRFQSKNNTFMHKHAGRTSCF